jgi:hypothetical protein
MLEYYIKKQEIQTFFSVDDKKYKTFDKEDAYNTLAELKKTVNFNQYPYKKYEVVFSIIN